MVDEALKYGKMPVKVLAPRILDFFQRISPELAQAIETEIRYSQLKSTIIYDCRPRKIETIAEINEDDHEISVSEPFLSFLWCLSYTVIVFYSERNPETLREPMERATKLFDYGLSLFQKWSSWDLGTPNPEHPDNSDKYISEANAVMSLAGVFLLCHEFGHQYLGHLTEPNTDSEQSIEYEFNADSYATSCTLDLINKDVANFEHTVKIAIVVGIGSILFDSDDMRGGPAHPDTDQRIVRVLSNITDNDPESEYWVHAIMLLNIWDLVYFGGRTEPDRTMTAKDHFEWLSNELKSR